MEIGSVKLESPLILAPMSGVTCASFRRLIHHTNPGKVGLYVSEFISVEGLTRQNERSLQMMKFREFERPFSVQIFGSEISRMIDAAKMVQDHGANIVDINCGCPVPKVVKKGGGCELMRQPEKLSKIISSISREVSIPVTVKIRSGWDNESRNALEIAKMAESSGAQMLAIHGRTRAEGYRGRADWDIISEVSNELSIPVVGSGDVVDYESAKKAMSTGVSGLMVGRAALLNPWVFSEIEGAGTYLRPADIETVDLLETYLEFLQDDLPEKAVIGKMKQLCSQVTRRVRGSKRERKDFLTSKSLDEMKEKFKVWRNYLGEQASLVSDSDASSELPLGVSVSGSQVAHPEYDSPLLAR